MRGSYIWAGLMTAAVIGWMATSDLIIGGQGPRPAEASANPGDEAAAVETAPFRVTVQTFEASERTARLNVRGRTEAADRVHLMAQADGLITEVAVEKGETVTTGQLVCRIETADRMARVLGAEAAVAQAELEYDAASKLSERGFAAETRVRAAKAALDSAAATLELALLAMRRTEIRSAIDGVVEELPVEVGSHLPIGGQCATVVALDPMRVIAQISERDVGALALGMPASATPVGGSAIDARIVYIAPTAEAATRTFRVEMEFPNPEPVVRDGITAQIAMDLDTTLAHKLPNSVLTLNDAGEVGVRSVDAANRVEFRPVRILDARADGVWVKGLPDSIRIITVGQEYVVEGEVVEPVVQTARALDGAAAETEAQ